MALIMCMGGGSDINVIKELCPTVGDMRSIYDNDVSAISTNSITLGQNFFGMAIANISGKSSMSTGTVTRVTALLFNSDGTYEVKTTTSTLTLDSYEYMIAACSGGGILTLS